MCKCPRTYEYEHHQLKDAWSSRNVRSRVSLQAQLRETCCVPNAWSNCVSGWVGWLAFITPLAKVPNLGHSTYARAVTSERHARQCVVTTMISHSKRTHQTVTLTIHFAHGTGEIVRVTETDEAVPFRLVRLLVAHHLQMGGSNDTGKTGDEVHFKL